MQLRIVKASGLDIDRHIDLLSKAFGQSAWAAQIGTTLTREFYIWKYFPPAGEAVISSVLVEGKVASSVSALPTSFRTPSGVRKGWQIADIATLPSTRRRGLYRRCLNALVESLGDETLVCFPNALSKKEIEGKGFGFATDVRTFVRPLYPFAARTAFTEPDNTPPAFEQSDPAEGSGRYSFFKNRNDLDWRYRKNPACQYNIISSDAGYCVLRSFNLFGSAVGIIMEAAAGAERAFCDLVRQAERVAAGNGLRANFMMTSSPLFPCMRTRYLPLPRVLLPKRQALFVRMPGGAPSSTAWDVQIGDWDGL